MPVPVAHEPVRATPSSSWVRVLPSLTDLAFILPIVFGVWKIGGVRYTLEGDTGWHIRTGEWILTHGRVPATDIFSYTKAGEPWFAWEWLWEVCFAIVHGRFGMAGAVLVTIAVLCFTSALLFRLVRRSCANPFIAFAVTWAAVAASSKHWLVRPHVFTMCFFVVTLYVVERSRERSSGLLWTLPALMLVWVNLHGGFLLGLAVLAAYALADALGGLVTANKTQREALYRRSAVEAGALAVGAGATLLNPYGYRLHVHIFRTLTGAESPLYRFVAEWQPLTLQGPLAWYVEPVLVLAVAGCVWHMAHRRFAPALLLAPLLHGSFHSLRNMPIFMLAAAPVAAAALDEGLRRLRRSSLPRTVISGANAFADAAEDFNGIDTQPRLHLAGAAVLCLFGATLLAAQPPDKLRSEYDPKLYPVNAVSQALSPGAGVIFTDDEWGDYLIYRFYPNVKVFVDGRFDLYGGVFTERYLDALNARHGWRSLLAAHRVDTVLLSVKTPLAGALKESADWSVLYDDGVAIIFGQRRADAVSAQLVPARDQAVDD